MSDHPHDARTCYCFAGGIKHTHDQGFAERLSQGRTLLIARHNRDPGAVAWRPIGWPEAASEQGEERD
jgi:hypothetical protein